MGRNVFTYVDDIVVASKSREDHLSDLAETFANMRETRLQLKPKKCIFGVRYENPRGTSYHTQELKPTGQNIKNSGQPDQRKFIRNRWSAIVSPYPESQVCSSEPRSLSMQYPLVESHDRMPAQGGEYYKLKAGRPRLLHSHHHLLPGLLHCIRFLGLSYQYSSTAGQAIMHCTHTSTAGHEYTQQRAHTSTVYPLRNDVDESPCMACMYRRTQQGRGFWALVASCCYIAHMHDTQSLWYMHDRSIL